MKRPPFTPAMFNPAFVWFDVALKTFEMLTASGHVIHTRVGRMARAGATPNARDRREFILMGTEKARAANESMLAVFTRLAGANFAMMANLWRPGLGLFNESAKLATAALAPIHRKATANSRRLARSSRGTRRTTGKGA